jgi:hypothetical protein
MYCTSRKCTHEQRTSPYRLRKKSGAKRLKTWLLAPFSPSFLVAFLGASVARACEAAIAHFSAAFYGVWAAGESEE